MTGITGAAEKNANYARDVVAVCRAETKSKAARVAMARLAVKLGNYDSDGRNVWKAYLVELTGTRANQKRMDDALSAIARFRATMAQGENRYGAYGDSCRESIARWQAKVDEITAPHQ